MAEITFDSLKSIEAQNTFCKEKRIPNFSPRCGICFRCNKDIFTEQKNRLSNTGITVELAGSQHILDCPHCGMSYCN
jgi:uncharacterized C2H2 Zn-finger protein